MQKSQGNILIKILQKNETLSKSSKVLQIV